jgi:hypothetical protein
MEKDLLEFHKNKKTKDGYAHNCKTCKSLYGKENREHLSEYNRDWKRANPDKSRILVRKWNHRDWAPGEHERAELERLSVKFCACCGSFDPHFKSGFCADHNKKTGVFRAYVCYFCNVMVGYVERHGYNPNEDIEVYLKRYGGTIFGKEVCQMMMDDFEKMLQDMRDLRKKVIKRKEEEAKKVLGNKILAKLKDVQKTASKCITFDINMVDQYLAQKDAEYLEKSFKDIEQFIEDYRYFWKL